MSHLVERIYARCCEVGECWEWQGAVHKESRAPVMRLHQKTQQVRRALAAALGHKVAGRVVSTRCMNVACVNPGHIQVMQRQALQRRTAKLKAAEYMNRSVRARIAMTQRGRSRLTIEDVAAIKEDTRPQRLIAQIYGISQTTVSSIKRGESWQDFSNPYLQLMK